MTRKKIFKFSILFILLLSAIFIDTAAASGGSDPTTPPTSGGGGSVVVGGGGGSGPSATPEPEEPEFIPATYRLENEHFRWGSSFAYYYTYPARSPNPILWNPYGTYVEQFDSTIAVNTQYRVKKFTAVFYKKTADGKYVVAAEFSQSVEDTSILEMTSFAFRPENITEDGEYIMVLGVVDLFNKIYFFEPETFILDSQPPVVTAHPGIPVINPNRVITSAAHYILKWKDINDNITTYPEDSDFIYVKYGNDPNPIPVNIKDAKDTNGVPLFIVDQQEVRLNTAAGTEFGPFTFYLKDEAGAPVSINKQLEGITYTYNTEPPVVTLDSNRSIYKSGDSVVLKVESTNPNLRIAWLGIEFEDGSYSVVNTNLPPVKIHEILFKEKIYNKATETQQFILTESLYNLEGDYYFLKDGVTREISKEKQLREILADTGYIPFKDITSLEIPLSNLQGKKGDFTILAEIRDNGGLANQIDSFGPLTFNDQDEDIIITARDKALPTAGYGEYNNAIELSIRKNADNILSFDVNITSLTLAESVNNYKTSAVLDSAVIPLLKDENVTQPKEELEITVTAYYASGKTTIFTRFVNLYSDNTGPVISQNPLFSSENTKIVVTDESNIDLIAVKYIDNNQTTLDFDSFIPAPTNSGSLNGWNLLSSQTSNYTGYNTILPGIAACIYAVDKWGNTNSLIFEKPESAGMTVINTPGDLVFDANGSAVLSGDILITCDLTIESGQNLTFGNTTAPTRVYFDSSIQGTPIKIINDGKIVLDTENAGLIFSGLNTITGAYKWFGIQNKTRSTLETTGLDPVEFNNAVAALSFENPAPPGNTPIVLSNIKAADCLMGIHFIDDADYTPLELQNCDFTALVYGIKFEITPDALPVMGNLEDYFTIDAFSSFTDIKRAEVYWKSMDVDALTTGL